ncbi:MAG TPA: enoyl-CoA hydratase family protein [Nocardioidaceae bacterium]|nr:enoyl-CoA hydratase family protein [Nocardioidaceae bacterium]
MTEGVELVHLERAGAVTTVTLDSPANRNALSRRLVAQLAACLRTAEDSAATRVVLLTHTGTTFCAGADLREAAGLGMERGTADLLALLAAVLRLGKPVVAVVRGHVRAGGIGLLGACDLAVVSNDSTYAFSEARLGLAPAVISLTTRTRLGDRDAARLFLTGEVFDGVEAARCGLVTRSVPAEDLPGAVEALSSSLARVSPQGARETKSLLNGPLLERIERDGADLTALSARLFASAEAREGMAAFRERRPPRWETQVAD